jgi:cytochrome P450
MALFIGSARVTDEKYAVAEAATRDMADYFRAMIAERRVARAGVLLQSAPHADLLTELVNLREPDGDHLSDDELIATCILLLFAGHETTTNHLANGMLALMRFPGEMAKLRARPELAAAAVEELLRYDGPSNSQVRIVREAYELHGKLLKPGDRVFIMLGAANRDERAYPNPDVVDIERDGPAHLTFGYGAHICLGFPLARLEGQVAFPALLGHFRSIEPRQAQVEWLRYSAACTRCRCGSRAEPPAYPGRLESPSCPPQKPPAPTRPHAEAPLRPPDPQAAPTAACRN